MPAGKAYGEQAMPDDRETAQRLREQAARYRRLPEAVFDPDVTGGLLELAQELEERADAEEERERAVPRRPARCRSRGRKGLRLPAATRASSLGNVALRRRSVGPRPARHDNRSLT